MLVLDVHTPFAPNATISLLLLLMLSLTAQGGASDRREKVIFARNFT